MASIISELPVKLAMSMSFNFVFYFMVNFRRNPGRFFFYWLMCIWCTFVMSHLFRSIGAVSTSISGAMTPATVLLLAMVIYTGFVIPTPSMLGWSRWINYINPVGYVFESLMVNEFHGREFNVLNMFQVVQVMKIYHVQIKCVLQWGLFQVMKWLVVPIIWLVLINITILINGETWVLPLICRILFGHLYCFN